MTSPGWEPDPYANQTAPGAGVPGQGFPGQGFPGQVGPVGSAGMTPAEQAAYRQGQRDLLAQARQPRMTVFRVICGIVWAAISVGFAFGVIANITGHGSAGRHHRRRHYLGPGGLVRLPDLDPQGPPALPDHLAGHRYPPRSARCRVQPP
jgi:hypothetical protein